MPRFEKGQTPTNKRHGESGGQKRTKLYTCWRNMLNRCYRPSTGRYASYGGRGIAVCDRWKDFEAFKADMGEPPSPRASLDRKDVNGNYEPSNCRWLDIELQTKNQTRSVNLTAFGKTQILADWAKEYGLAPGRITRRIKLGWPIERALITRPLQHPYGKRRSRFG